ncbi:hypothetical protein [Bacteroides sp.]|uniref:hypothetical protein n=1 Tax=Bacteroides sp. TaxID=29523 RepID=UPI003A925A01
MEIRVCHITFLIQIANGKVIVTLFVGGISAKGIFLPVSVADGIRIPVKVIGIFRKDLCIRNQITICVE